MNTAFQKKITKLFFRIWEFFPVSFPERKSSIYINLILHTEEIAFQKIFEATKEFIKYFYSKTGKKPILCVTTPFCPQSKLNIEKAGITNNIYMDRVKELAEYAEIGYHGHFYHTTKNNSGDATIIPVNEKKYSVDNIKSQIAEEMNWFEMANLKPVVYTAGWWFLTPDIVKEIEKYNFKMDCSIRRNINTNSFGGRYIEDSVLPPVGVNFLLPPSEKITEIQSLFGFAVASYRLKPLLKRLIDFNISQDLCLVFYFHDFDIPEYSALMKKNICSLTSLPFLKWENARRMIEFDNGKKAYVDAS